MVGKNRIRWMKGIDAGESVEMYRDGHSFEWKRGKGTWRSVWSS